MDEMILILVNFKEGGGNQIELIKVVLLSSMTETVYWG
jgi:hypothetical protein